jgi:predicted site-specific integrase-resolvase
MMVYKTYFDCTKSLDFSRSTRKGLHELLVDVTKRRVGLVLAESPDRIAQIGHELFQLVMSNYRVRVLYASSDPVNPRYKEETIREIAHVVRELKRSLDKAPRDGADRNSVV